MTKKPARTRPLDRDGDGKDGGSLPGNQTAPMAKVIVTAPWDDTATPDQVKVKAEEAARAAWGDRPFTVTMKGDKAVATVDEGLDGTDDWTRDNDVITLKLEEAGVRDHDEQPIDLANVIQWPDEDARAAETFADAMMAAGKFTDHNGTERNADGSAIDLPEILRERTVVTGAGASTGDDALDAIAEAEPDAVATTLQDHDTDGEATFTAEEIAAGQTPVVEQEGEATATAADQATQLDETDPLATVETDKAPIAVRLSDLQVLTSARRLYHTREGYSATWNAPFLDDATVDGWVAAGLAEAIPSAGNTGGVRATDEARQLERQLRREQAEAA